MSPRKKKQLLAVLPVVDRELGRACLDSIFAPASAAGLEAAELLVIDNSREGFGVPECEVYRDPDGHNLGVARAWNVGARRVLNGPEEYLLIVSSSMLFGPHLHSDWRWEMDRAWGEPLIEATGHSWHLIGIHRRCLEQVGLFDSNYWPGYFEQIDWCYRLFLAQGIGGGKPGDGMDWPRCWVNAISQGHGRALALVTNPAGPLLAYYAEKWGGEKGQEKHLLPWGDRPLDWFEEVPIPELARRYEIPEGEWW